MSRMVWPNFSLCSSGINRRPASAVIKNEPNPAKASAVMAAILMLYSTLSFANASAITSLSSKWISPLFST